MKINRIAIENFRNIEALSADFDDVNIIWGENAQGKTNLLEALYLFSGARSFRGAKDKELLRFGTEQSRLQLQFTAQDREQTAEIIIGEKKIAYQNGIKKKSPAQLGDDIKAVVFSPVHLNMIKGAPEERRHFIDGALCQIKANYRKILKEYHRALTQRNMLLKDMRRHPDLENMLFIWDGNLARLGAKIIFQRMKYIEAIMPHVQAVFGGISAGSESITLAYEGAKPYEADEAAIEEALLAALAENHMTDRINKTTSVGPHRDDMAILINGNSARAFGSQGQQRSCVLALKLAEAQLLSDMTGAKPVALLDDVMSELDEKRQDYILNHIQTHQVFITCCDKEQILRLKEGKTFHIEKGKII